MNRMPDHITDGPQFEDEPCDPDPEFDPGAIERQEDLDNLERSHEHLLRQHRKRITDDVLVTISDIARTKWEK